MAESHCPKIGVLNYHNNASWSCDMKFILKDKNLWKIVKGSETCLGPDKDQKAYDEKAQKALSIIFLNLGEDLKNVIENCDYLKMTRELLISHLMPDSRATHFSFYHSFLECFMEHGETVRKYFNRLSRIIKKLKCFRKTIDDIYCSFQVLKRLPERFQLLMQFLLIDSGNKFTYSEIVLHFIAKETRIELREKEFSGSNSTKVQFVSNQNISKETVSNNSSRHNNVLKANATCYKCQQKGHYANHCTKTISNQFKYNRGRSRGSSLERPSSTRASFNYPHIFIAENILKF